MAINEDKEIEITVGSTTFSAIVVDDDRPPLSADYNEDGLTNGLDFLAWQIGFGTTSSAAHAEGDSDWDGDVDRDDLSVWESQFCRSTVASDFDLNQRVDGLDFLAWQLGWGTLYGGDDLAAWQQEW